MNKKTLSVLAFTAALGFSGAAGAGLIDIDPNDGMIYDDVLDITWLQDANYALTSGYVAANLENDGGFDDIFADGRMGWEAAMTWADQLVYGGYDNWRLASMSVSGGVPTGSASSVVNCATSTEVTCRDNELGYMYYYNLTPSGDTPPTNFGTNLTGNQGLFTNIQSVYWSGTEYAPNPNNAWNFNANNGNQNNDNKDNENYAWAVRSGE